MHNLVPPSKDDMRRVSPSPREVDENGEKRCVRVLVVEDEWLVSMEVEATLEEEGFDVVGIVATADEAISLTAMHRPDLVLMDIRLRGSGDGVDAAIDIWRRFGVRSLFVSAHRDPLTIERAQVGNPLGWVSKPFSRQQLLSAINLALDEL